VVNFQKTFFPVLRGITLAFIRHRLDLEAERLKPIYRAKGSDRDPRQDLFVVADFDDEVGRQFDVSPDSKKSAVFVFAGDGRLIARWNQLPSSEDLSAALQAAR
jgi:hypothetical protein